MRTFAGPGTPSSLSCSSKPTTCSSWWLVSMLSGCCNAESDVLELLCAAIPCRWRLKARDHKVCIAVHNHECYRCPAELESCTSSLPQIIPSTISSAR